MTLANPWREGSSSPKTKSIVARAFQAGALFGSGAACLLLGRYEEATAFVRRLLLLSPNDIRGLFILTGSALFGGKLAEAEETVARIKQLFPHLRSSQLRRAYRVRKPEHMAIVERMIARISLPE